MAIGLSEYIRSIAQAKYVNPAIRRGDSRFSIRVRDLIADLQADGYPPSYTPQICSALQTRKFLLENRLEIEEVEGPPKKVSPTVVIRYRALGNQGGSEGAASLTPSVEDPSDRAKRLTGKLRGILREEMLEYGGGEAFLRWVRSEESEKS